MTQTLGYQIDIQLASKEIIQQACIQYNIAYNAISTNLIELPKKMDEERFLLFTEYLRKFGVSVQEKTEDSFVDKIKATISEIVQGENGTPILKTSAILEQKLLKSYSSIARAFKEETYMSIENYVILQKLERAKELIISDDYTLTEIAHKLNYSSVAHLSSQFKKTTGLSASAFVRIMNRRKETLNMD